MTRRKYPRKIKLLSNEHIKKYIGDKNDIVMRSSWEEDFFRFFISRKDVKKIGSENIVIPYRDYDLSSHRYFVDFYFEVIDKDGKLQRFLIEVKPYKETQPPTKPKIKGKKRSTRYKKEVLTYLKNMKKWESAINYAYKHGMQFRLMTDDPKSRGKYKIWHWNDKLLALPLGSMNLYTDK